MGAIAFLYGLACYALFLVVFLYAIAFVGNFPVPKTIDSAPQDAVAVALAIDLLLLGLFAVQHSVMARPAFKRWWTQMVPRSVERSTYVLFASLILALLFWQWRPIEGTVWKMQGAAAAALWVLFGAGWLIVLLATFMINHFDLFGLRQVYLRAKGQAYTQVDFKTVAFYKFAGATTAYIFIGIFLEERDLAAAHGEGFARYRREVPMIVPRVSGYATEQGDTNDYDAKAVRR
jgi:protein-S-isoprenylcysteine O-methyltransferase Ste14